MWVKRRFRLEGELLVTKWSQLRSKVQVSSQHHDGLILLTAIMTLDVWRTL
jgi:hypothetical protein